MILPLFLSSKTTQSQYNSWTNTFTQYYQDQLLSNRLHNLPQTAKQQPVILTVHGFGSSPFEWKDLHHYFYQKTNLISHVFLGCHENLNHFEKNHQIFQKQHRPYLVRHTQFYG